MQNTSGLNCQTAVKCFSTNPWTTRANQNCIYAYTLWYNTYVLSVSHTHTHTHTHTHIHTHTHTLTEIHSLTQPHSIRIHTRAHTRALTQAHTHTYNPPSHTQYFFLSTFF